MILSDKLLLSLNYENVFL